MKTLLLCKTDIWSGYAAALAKRAFGDDLVVHTGRTSDPFPVERNEPPAQVLSFLSPWIVPAWLLERSTTALNFHPASRDYPGTGCYNFALYEETTEYGAVCHHMAAKVDVGAMVAERRFVVYPKDSVETLKLRTMTAMLDLFGEIIDLLATGQPLPEAAGWTRLPFVRRELDALCQIHPEMDESEIRRRVRATTYPGYPGAVLVAGGIEFAAPVPIRKPLA